MNAKKAIFSKVAKGTLLGGALAITGFVSAADLNGVSHQIAKSFDGSFQPLADAQAFPAQQLGVASPEATRAIGASGLAIRGQHAFVIGDDAQQRQAPDGFYRLSNDQILKVASGNVYVKDDELGGTNCCWKDWLQKIKSTGAPRADSDVLAAYRSVMS